jgi:hypothetical protein
MPLYTESSVSSLLALLDEKALPDTSLLENEEYEYLYYSILCKIKELYRSLQLCFASKFIHLDSIVYTRPIDFMSTNVTLTVRNLRDFLISSWFLLHDETVVAPLDKAIKYRKIKAIMLTPLNATGASLPDSRILDSHISPSPYEQTLLNTVQGLQKIDNYATTMNSVYQKLQLGHHKSALSLSPASSRNTSIPVDDFEAASHDHLPDTLPINSMFSTLCSCDTHCDCKFICSQHPDACSCRFRQKSSAPPVRRLKVKDGVIWQSPPARPRADSNTSSHTTKMYLRQWSEARVKPSSHHTRSPIPEDFRNPLSGTTMGSASVDQSELSSIQPVNMISARWKQPYHNDDVTPTRHGRATTPSFNGSQSPIQAGLTNRRFAPNPNAFAIARPPPLQLGKKSNFSAMSETYDEMPPPPPPKDFISPDTIADSAGLSSLLPTPESDLFPMTPLTDINEEIARLPMVALENIGYEFDEDDYASYSSSVRIVDPEPGMMLHSELMYSSSEDIPSGLGSCFAMPKTPVKISQSRLICSNTDREVPTPARFSPTNSNASLRIPFQDGQYFPLLKHSKALAVKQLGSPDKRQKWVTAGGNLPLDMRSEVGNPFSKFNLLEGVDFGSRKIQKVGREVMPVDLMRKKSNRERVKGLKIFGGLFSS